MEVLNHAWAKETKKTLKNPSTLLPRWLKYLNGQDFVVLEAQDRENRRDAPKRNKLCLTRLYLVPSKSPMKLNRENGLYCTSLNRIVVEFDEMRKRVPSTMYFPKGTKFKDVTKEFKEEYEALGMCANTDDRHVWEIKKGTKKVKVCKHCGLQAKPYTVLVKKTNYKYT